MKGQLSIEVIVAMIIFIIFISYLFFEILKLRPIYLQEIKAEKIRAEAYQLSELLINDPGEPIDWNTANVKRIGLSDHIYNLTNLISWSKAQNLNSLCSNYELVREKVGIKDYQFSITVVNRDTGYSIFCSPPQPRGISVINFTVKRIVGINQNNYIYPGEVLIRVW